MHTNPTPGNCGFNAQALDDFCADSIRRMRGMKSFGGFGSSGSLARGRIRALDKFVRELRKAFPNLADKELTVLRRFARSRAEGWGDVETATAAIAKATQSA